jgi:hypothetical protein
MAQKRMFDRSIIDTERFIDLSISAKALYFLLGMHADDEGFVSAKTITRIHGTSDDDLGLLLLKGFCIRFDSGIVVITDWKKNNWLDSRRIRRTEYTQEKAQLLTIDGRYVLSSGLARGEERRIDKSSSKQNAEPEAPMSRERMQYHLQKGREVLKNQKSLGL